MLSVYLVHVNVTGQARVAEAMSLPTFAAGVPRGAVVRIMYAGHQRAVLRATRPMGTHVSTVFVSVAAALLNAVDLLVVLVAGLVTTRMCN
jgi:hypothetical protein